MQCQLGITSEPPLLRDEVVTPVGELPSKPTQVQQAESIWEKWSLLGQDKDIKCGPDISFAPPSAWGDFLDSAKDTYACICQLDGYLFSEIADDLHPAMNADRYTNVCCRMSNIFHPPADYRYYINASHLACPTPLIATQGPMLEAFEGADTMREFYWLIKHSKAPLVVSLGPEMESKRKFSPFWAPEAIASVKGVEVQALDAGAEPWTERRVIVNEHEARSIHFEKWPDHGEADIGHFLRLVEVVRENPGAILHCSAGIGRTGCVAVAVAVQHELEKRAGKPVTGQELMALIASMVLRLRMQRPGIITSHEQLGMLHRALTQWQEKTS